MQQLAHTAPRSHDGNFAELLADLTSPGKIPPERDLDGMEDDMATLSYEQALLNSSRSVSQPFPAEVSKPESTVRIIPPENRVIGSQHARRSASVTVRFSASEAEQLHVRAAEAGMTVSAYLRSCAFEVENLRAQVKSTLAELRSTVTAETKQNEHKRRWLSFFRGWSRPRSSRSTVQPSGS